MLHLSLHLQTAASCFFLLLQHKIYYTPTAVCACASERITMMMMMMKAPGTTIGAGGTILCSQRFTICNCSCNFSPHRPSSSSSSLSWSLLTNQEEFLAKPIKYLRLRRLTTIPKAVDSTQSSSLTASDKSIVPDDQFSLAKVSFGVIGLGLGVTLLSYGFGAYFKLLPGSEWSALMLTYGFPLAIIGMALKYAELKPVPCLTFSDAAAIREKCATPVLKQVRNDVIRYRYGDEQHLEEALKRIFQYGLGGGISRRAAPVLQRIREEVTEDGKYCLVLVFEAKALKLSDFEQRQAKFTSFFGPGISAEIAKGEEDLYEVRLISTTTP